MRRKNDTDESVRARWEERFWTRVRKGPKCWRWLGYHTPKGYAITQEYRGFQNYYPVPVYRVTYQLLKGPIPVELQLDHLCRKRWCVNPDHLEAVTTRENLLRSPLTAAGRNARKKRCKRGHRFEGKNLVMVHDRRRCRACTLMHTRNWRERNR